MNKNKTMLVSLAVACAGMLVVSSNSFGAPISAGLNELELEASLVNQSGAGKDNHYYGDVTSLNLAVTYGRFLTDEVEAGARVGFAYSAADEITAFAFAPGVFGAYYFPMDSDLIAPYAGARAGLNIWDLESDSGVDFLIGAYGGAKFFIAKGAAIKIEPFLQLIIGDDTLVDVGVASGISLFF
ncbi:MAG: hypothetical protein WCL44_11340 [bacterium]